MKRKALGSVLSVLVASLVSAAAPPARADGESFSSFNNQGNNGDKYMTTVNFNSTDIPVGVSGALNGKKYWGVSLGTYSGTAQCFSIETFGSGDTRIWVYDAGINDYRTLNNTANGSALAAARVWLKPATGGTQLANPVITATSNSLVFSATVTKVISATSEAACTVGSTYVKSTSAGTTTIKFVNAN
jgi:hypothetical protein